MNNEDVRALVVRMVSGLIVENRHLEVSVGGRNCVNVEIRVSRSDTPRVIGKAGAHFKAIRSILLQIGMTQGKLIEVPQVLPAIHGGVPEKLPKFHPNPNWPKGELTRLIKDVVEAATGRGAGVVLNATAEAYKCEVMVKMGDAMPKEQRAEFFQSLSTLFSAIGKTCGVILSFDYE